MKELFTQKLFFGKYDHRVTMNVAHYHRHGENSIFPHPIIVEYLIKELDPKDGIRIRHSSVYSTKRPSQHTLYFADKRILAMLQERFGEHLVEVMKPVSDDHTQALVADKVLVREKFFHGKYRFCIRASRRHIPNTYKSTSAHLDEMVKWCKETFKHLDERVDYYIYDGWTKSFFFTNPADVLLMKLTWADDIDRTERIMLLSELPKSDDNAQ